MKKGHYIRLLFEKLVVQWEGNTVTDLTLISIYWFRRRCNNSVNRAYAYHGEVLQSNWRLLNLFPTSCCRWWLSTAEIVMALFAIAALTPPAVVADGLIPFIPPNPIPLIPVLPQIPLPTKQFAPFRPSVKPFIPFVSPKEPTPLSWEDIIISCKICCTELWESLTSTSCGFVVNMFAGEFVKFRLVFL